MSPLRNVAAAAATLLTVAWSPTTASAQDPPAPRLETIAVEGASRTPNSEIVEALGLTVDQRLTPDDVARAQRRLDEFPTLDAARVRVVAGSTGARVDALVDERSALPHGLAPLAALGAYPLFVREVRVDVTAPARLGARWTAFWLWPEARRSAGLELAAPAPFALPGLIHVEGSWERQTYLPPAANRARAFEEVRARGSVGLSDWATGSLRWEAGTTFERVRDTNFVGLQLALGRRLADDHVAVGATEGAWLAPAGRAGIGRTTLGADWRSSTDERAAGWRADTRLTVATAGAPLAFWPGAGAGLVREALMRAHPLLDDNVVCTSAVLGRGLSAGTLSYERPARRVAGALVGVAGFLDVARAWHRFGVQPPIWQADAGVGARVHASGIGGIARLDLAVGLRDGAVALSAGWDQAWARW
jgi:hypothetical protein